MEPLESTLEKFIPTVAIGEMAPTKKGAFPNEKGAKNKMKFFQ